MTPPDNDPLSPERRASVAAILDRSREMLHHAKKGEWERLAELEQARRALIEGFFASPPQPQEAAAVAEMIQAVAELDAKTVALAEQGRDSTAEALKVIANRQRAAEAYGGHRRR